MTGADSNDVVRYQGFAYDCGWNGCCCGCQQSAKRQGHDATFVERAGVVEELPTATERVVADQPQPLLYPVNDHGCEHVPWHATAYGWGDGPSPWPVAGNLWYLVQCSCLRTHIYCERIKAFTAGGCPRPPLCGRDILRSFSFLKMWVGGCLNPQATPPFPKTVS